MATPATPTLSVSISGTTATATVTATAGLTVNLYKKATTDSAWVLAGTRTGSGTISAASLTAAMQYVFIAVATDGTEYSLPSAPVVAETDPAAAANELDSVLPDFADCLLAEFGRQMTYRPKTGGSRAIIGILDYDDISGVPGVTMGNSPYAKIAVKNLATGTYPGITSTEVDTGGDKIDYAVRHGQTAQSRSIRKIISQDAGLLVLGVY